MFPTFNQFARWANHYRVLPLWIEPQLPSRDLVEWVHSLQAQEAISFFLHSAPAGQAGPLSPQSRYSYIALDAPRYQLYAEGDTLTLRQRTAGGVRQEALKIGNPYERFYGWFSRLAGPRVD